MEDVHEPLETYRSFLKEAHARHVSEFFEDLVRRSGVDEQQNIKYIKELRFLEQKLGNENSTSRWWKVLRIATAAGMFFSLLYIGFQHLWIWLIAPVVVFTPLILKLNKIIANLDLSLEALTEQRDAKSQEALQQMEALNGLYDWDIVSKLVQKTVPRLELDPYFTNGRLNDLRNTFGLNEGFNDERSIIFSHSGVLNGNPFVLAQTQDHWMSTKTYHGSLSISWSETVHDSDGHLKTETRHETLHASVDAAFPSYGNHTFFIYGNEAAPDLTFSRSSSNLSNLEGGIFSDWKKRRAINKLENKSRQMEDGKSFTVMANREFDALFGATDRDHEVQFRLLFTPLAQQEMLKLLKDKTIGYGDDFEFVKQQMINLITPQHMRSTDISADPSKFKTNDLAAARKYFNNYHNDFFRSFFFGIAPLLVIPLYQQHRSHADIYKDVYATQSCFWEHESIANYFGEEHFEHPECVTRNILKTTSRFDANGSQIVNVTAHGYRGIDRTTYVSVRGGDGYSHDVRVDWVEYQNVERNSNLVVREVNPLKTREDSIYSEHQNSDWEMAFQNHGISASDAVLRRSVASALLSGSH